MKNCCLTIAGSDSGGNAGVQADLRAFHSYGLHGCTVFAALTAQNPFGVSAIHPVPADFVAAQLDAVLGVYSIRALKTGMLGDPASIEVLADRLAQHPEIAKVIDPVMIATSGARLVSPDARDAILKKLVPLATLITPNLLEAQEIAAVGADHWYPPSEASCEAGAMRGAARTLARAIYDAYGVAVLVKGGHATSSPDAIDVLYDGRDLLTFSSPWIANPVSTHGTGCSLAAAIAAELALGRSLPDAVRGAKDYVHKAIENAYLVGADCGVLGFVK